MSAAVYGGVEGGMTEEADEFIRSEDMLDKHQVPALEFFDNPYLVLRHSSFGSD
jgi:hypothetical protein